MRLHDFYLLETRFYRYTNDIGFISLLLRHSYPARALAFTLHDLYQLSHSQAKLLDATLLTDCHLGSGIVIYRPRAIALSQDCQYTGVSTIFNTRSPDLRRYPSPCTAQPIYVQEWYL